MIRVIHRRRITIMVLPRSLITISIIHRPRTIISSMPRGLLIIVIMNRGLITMGSVISIWIIRNLGMLPRGLNIVIFLRRGPICLMSMSRGLNNCITMSIMIIMLSTPRGLTDTISIPRGLMAIIVMSRGLSIIRVTLRTRILMITDAEFVDWNTPGPNRYNKFTLGSLYCIHSAPRSYH